MIICKCGSIRVDVKNLDFARVEPEGAPAAKYEGPNHSFYCHDCKLQWKSIPEDWKLYYEYQSLVPKTTFFVNDMKDGNYGSAPYIDANDLMRRDEIARIIVESYQHLLDLSPSEWHNIKLDAG